jgi:hypothetical protein
MLYQDICSNILTVSIWVFFNGFFSFILSFLHLPMCVYIVYALSLLLPPLTFHTPLSRQNLFCPLVL